MKDTISVIVPMKNMEQYIEDCLDSIVKSTKRPMEVIVVDFGSVDGSMDIVRRYEKKFSFIRLLQDPFGDAATSRNKGLQYAAGEYIAFIDCDDWIAPNMLEVLLEKIQQEQLDFISCNYVNVFHDRNEVVKMQEEYSACTEKDNLNQVLSWMALGGMGAEIWTKLYRTAFLKEHNIRFESENGINGEDVFFNYCVLLNCPKFCTINEVLYYHRIRSESLSHRKNVHLTMRFITIIEKLLNVANILKVDARQGIAQLLISLIIQDVMSQEAKEEKISVLDQYLENKVIYSLCRQATFHSGISIKRRGLCILLSLRCPRLIVRFVDA